MDLVAIEPAAFIAGLLFGSFLNVCIARIPRGESVVKPRSRCLRCGAPIRWYDNLPILSFLALQGRCRDCHSRISFQYPLVELALGLWFTATALRTQGFFADPSPATGPATFLLVALGQIVLGFLLLGLIVMDWQTYTLPDAFTFTGIAIAFVLVFLQAIFLGPTEDQVILSNHHIQLSSPGNAVDHGNVFLTGPEALIFGRLIAVTACAALLLLIRWLYRTLRHREGLGLGDVKLLAMIAAFLGFWPALLALFAGVLSASLYSIYLLARRRATGSTRLPLGSFLAAGGLLAALFGARILNAYAALLR